MKGREMPDNNVLRELPSVDEVLRAVAPLTEGAGLSHELVTGAAREAIAGLRERVLAGETDAAGDAGETGDADEAGEAGGAGGAAGELLDMAAAGTLAGLEAHFRPSMRRVVNATGVIVHTNLGRSALAESAIEAVCNVARGYSTLEYDTDRMERGSRHDHCEGLICALTGAEAAIAVNNNAAAVMLVLSEFASGREAIVSRGEEIEIGGSFRIPDIMAHSGARMVEVGTTNKTHLADYERAVTGETAMFLKVHTSNYRVLGFSESVSGRELRGLADRVNKERGTADAGGASNAAGSGGAAGSGDTGGAERLLVFEDLGSGLLCPIKGCDEPTVSEALRAGCDIVSFSGDKLLGGPQAGIVVGRREIIDRLKANPLVRAMRLDKMTLAALEATLRLYLDPKRARAEVPTLRMLEKPVEAVREEAELLADELRAAVPDGSCDIEVADSVARAGGGSLPMHDIPSAAVEVAFTENAGAGSGGAAGAVGAAGAGAAAAAGGGGAAGSGRDAQGCMRHLASERKVPVVARISHGKIVFDVRTLLDGERGEIVAGVAEYLR